MKHCFHFFFACVLLFVFVADIVEAQVTFGTGKIYVRSGKYGEIRIFSAEGVDTLQHINRISLIAAGNKDQVIDYWNDLDIEVPTELVANSVLSDYEISGAYNNAYSGLSPNFLIKQNIYSWNNQSYCIVKCEITNQETSEMPLLAGLDVIQYVDYTWENDHIFFDAANNLLTQFDSHYVGIKLLSEATTSAQVFKWYEGYSDPDSSYYAWLHGGTFDTDTLLTDADGGVSILGGPPTTFQPAASKTIYFAVSVGTNNSEMLANMLLARQKYSTLTSVETDITSIPSKYLLEQNYPNPFNPSTKISYQLPQSGFANLKVFNTLGREVATLVNEEKSAGKYEVDFNAGNLSTGVYFYKLTSNNFTQVNKMLLVK